MEHGGFGEKRGVSARFLLSVLDVAKNSAIENGQGIVPRATVLANAEPTMMNPDGMSMIRGNFGISSAMAKEQLRKYENAHCVANHFASFPARFPAVSRHFTAPERAPTVQINQGVIDVVRNIPIGRAAEQFILRVML